MPNESSDQVTLLPALKTYLDARRAEAADIDAERREALQKLGAFVADRRAAGEPAQLIFICTHNSRRSHMGQLLAAAAAAYHGVSGVQTYSGGTEVTAFNPRAVAAMRRAGFEIPEAEGDNPHYAVRFAAGAPAQACFSKVYDDDFNPKQDFAAVMTCTSADAACPIVRGAALRASLPYVDPKAADGTPGAEAAYDARARQIACEMLYLFSQVAR